MAGDCSMKDTLRALVLATSAYDVAVAMFTDMTVSGFHLIPEIVVKNDLVFNKAACLLSSLHFFAFQLSRRFAYSLPLSRQLC